MWGEEDDATIPKRGRRMRVLALATVKVLEGYFSLACRRQRKKEGGKRYLSPSREQSLLATHSDASTPASTSIPHEARASSKPQESTICGP